MEWMILPLKRYFDFSGRSRRKEYWMFVLFTIICSFALGIADELLGLTYGDTNGLRQNGVLSSLFSLATFVPSLAVAVRRLHDTDRSGWWLFLPFIAAIVVVAVAVSSLTRGTGDLAGFGTGMILTLVVLGISGIVLLVFFCIDGTRGPNRFGEDPKGVAYDGVFD